MADSSQRQGNDQERAEKGGLSGNSGGDISQFSNGEQAIKRSIGHEGHEDDPQPDDGTDEPNHLRTGGKRTKDDELSTSQRKRSPPSVEESSTAALSFRRGKKKAKKPDSGYSIFFRHERARLLESGEAIEDIFEKEVAPISTLETANQMNKALVKVIAKRWNNLNLSSRLRYETLAQQQKKKLEDRRAEGANRGDMQEGNGLASSSSIPGSDQKPRNSGETRQFQSPPASSTVLQSTANGSTRSARGNHPVLAFDASGMNGSSEAVEGVIRNVLALLGTNLPGSRSGPGSPLSQLPIAFLGPLFQTDNDVLQIAIDTIRIILGVKQALKVTIRPPSGQNNNPPHGEGAQSTIDSTRTILEWFSGHSQASSSIPGNLHSTANVGFSDRISRPATLDPQTTQNPLASFFASQASQFQSQPLPAHGSTASTLHFPEVAAPQHSVRQDFSTAATNSTIRGEANGIARSQPMSSNIDMSSAPRQQVASQVAEHVRGRGGVDEQDLLVAIQQLLAQQQQNQTGSMGPS